MAKGPAPKGEYTGKSSVFSTRIRPDLREELEAATKTSGRSLSQEVEHRLRRSFVEDDKIADAFGDRRTYRMMRLISDAIHLSQENHHRPNSWLDHSYAFEIAVYAARGVLEAVQPNGPALDDDALNASAALGDMIAAKIWRDVVKADDSIPLSESTLADRINSIAKADIGEEVLSRVIPAMRAAVFRNYAPPSVVQDAIDDLQKEMLEEEERERNK